MKKKKSYTGLITALLVIAAVVILVKHFHIKAFNVVKPGVLYTSGQPRGMDYTRLLYKYHIATIINVRLPSEHRERNWLNEELVWVRNNGVKYVEMPIERKDYFPDAKTQDRFLALMDNNANLPVLLHGSGDDKRVAMLTAVWLRKVEGYDVTKTVAEVRKIIDDRRLTNDETAFITGLTK